MKLITQGQIAYLLAKGFMLSEIQKLDSTTASKMIANLSKGWYEEIHCEDCDVMEYRQHSKGRNEILHLRAIRQAKQALLKVEQR